MVSAPKDIPIDGSRPPLDAQRSLFPDPRQVARRSHRPCPNRGSITVRSRDGRDMCLIRGYLQSHA
jgi:hypothetical protein